MPSLTGLLLKWPVIRQIRQRTDGTGLEAMSDRTRAMHARIDGASVARSICPYCGVGCVVELHAQDDRIVKVTSPSDSSVTDGHLCIKGRFGFEFVNNRPVR